MPIIPSPGPRPSVVTVVGKIDSSPVVAGGPLDPLFIYTVGSGTVLYAENLQAMFDAAQVPYSPFPGMTMYAQGYFDITNNGTIWSSHFPGVNQYGTKWLALDNVLKFTNNGLVVLETVGNIEFGAQLTAFGIGNSRLRTLVNTGSIYVLNTTQDSTSWSAFLTSYNGQIDISNSGLIAVRAVGAVATGITLANGGHILNSATGQILAEGNSAVAVRSSFSMAPIGIENYGLIEAAALGAAPAVGVWLEADEVYNYASGTIHSDIAVYGSGTVTNAGLIVGDVVSQQNDFLNVTNMVGGQIQGDVVLGTIADTLNNRGAITGNVWMEAGNDVVDSRNGGVIGGITDLGIGNDIYHGEAGQDLVAGDTGNDSIFGYDGNDLLLGGDSDDIIDGGAGADGLYGENGNDALITAGADVARGGNGNDVFRTGDYSFALIDGQGGNDTWVLPTGARLLDLTTVAASARVQRIETIELTGSQGLVVRSSDVAAISGGNRLMVVQTGSDALHLVGGWQANGSVTVDGLGHTSYLLNGAEVLVRGGGSVALVASAPGGTTGLDAIAAGGPAPEPGASTGLYLTPPILYVNALEIRENTTIEASDTWYTEGTNPALYSYVDGVTLTVNGGLFSYNDVSAGSRAIQFINMETVVVNGRVGAFSTGPLLNPLPPHFPSTLEGAAAIRDAFAVVNNGIIEADAEFGTASGVGTAIFTAATPAPPDGPGGAIPASLRVYDGIEDIDNFGVIDVYAAHGHAFGTADSTSFLNAASGSIVVRGYQLAVGVLARGEATNAGTITASILPGGTGAAYGVVLLTDGALTEHHLVNSGTITATIAVFVMRELASGSTAPVRLHLQNSGTISGNVFASEIADLVVNSGTITGEVRLGGGNDSYDSRTGTQLATIFGEEGDDILLTGNGTQMLDGGAGVDSMAAGAGDDVYIVDVSGDIVTEAANEGIDTVRSTALVYSLSANIEKLQFIGVGNATLTGNALANEIMGGDGNDVLNGAGGVDILRGGAGNDRLLLGSGSNGSTVEGGLGTDIFVIGATVTSLASISGIEALEFVGGANLTLTGTQFAVGIATTAQISGTGALTVNMDMPGFFASKLMTISGGVSLTVNGTNGSDLIKLGNAANTVNAGDGIDQIKGGDLVDIINGGAGGDKINGAGGADILTGGAGADIFKYANASDSLSGNSDTITDYEIGIDKLNFAKIDTNPGIAGDQGFSFIGNAFFSGTGSAQIRYVAAAGDLLVQADINGDGLVDMEIVLQGRAGGTLTAADFVL